MTDRVLSPINAMREAALLAELAGELLAKASCKVRDTKLGSDGFEGNLRGVNYWLCNTQSDAERMSEWIHDLLGPRLFYDHGQPPHIFKSGLCDGCEREARKAKPGAPVSSAKGDA